MKIALCISGQMRGNAEKWKHYLNLFSGHDVHTYVDVWDRMGVTTAIDRVLPSGYLNYFYSGAELKNFALDRFSVKYPSLYQGLFVAENVSEPFISDLFNPKKISIEPTPEEFLNKKSFKGVEYPVFLKERNPRDINCLLMFYKIWKCFNLVRNSGEKYDFVVRIRSDLDFSENFSVNFDEIKENEIWVKSTARDDHVDDQFAVGSYAAMEKYCKLWECLPRYWSSSQSSESIYEVSGFLLARHLTKEGIKTVKKDWGLSLSLARIEKDKLINVLEREFSRSPSDFDFINATKELACEYIYDEIFKKKSEYNINFSKKYSNDFEKSFASTPNQLNGFILEREKDWEGAKVNYLIALSKDENSFMSYTGLARVFYQNKKFDKSISYWIAALSQRKSNWICMREIARCYQKISEKDLADLWLKKAIGFSNSHPSVMNLLNF